MIAITGGGTGGHLAIAKALAQEWQKMGHKAIYVGSTLGQDKTWFAQSPLFMQCYFLDSVGVVNKSGLNRLKALYKQFQCLLQARKILKAHRVKCVISVGGFSAGGASLAAITLRIPLFIHEQNAIKGTLNKILSPFAKAIFGSFPSLSKHFIHTSYPVRDIFFETARIREHVKNLLFLGGSQGAKGINDFAIQIAPELLKRGINIAHQCGERDFERVISSYKQLRILEQIDVFAFDDNLAKRLQTADLCIARAGASSLWEMSANGLIGVLVPYPYAAKDHQYYNALSFTQDGLGLLCRENDLKCEDVLAFIDSLQDGILSEKSRQVMAKITPNGTKDILNHIQTFLDNTSRAASHAQSSAT